MYWPASVNTRYWKSTIASTQDTLPQSVLKLKHSRAFLLQSEINLLRIGKWHHGGKQTYSRRKHVWMMWRHRLLRRVCRGNTDTPAWLYWMERWQRGRTERIQRDCCSLTLSPPDFLLLFCGAHVFFVLIGFVAQLVLKQWGQRAQLGGAVVGTTASQQEGPGWAGGTFQCGLCSRKVCSFPVFTWAFFPHHKTCKLTLLPISKASALHLKELPLLLARMG